MAQKLEEIEAILRKHKEELGERFGVRSIAIFGSYARGEESELSDVDILVEFERPVGWEIVDLRDYLEELLGLPVDLITKNASMGRKGLWEHIKGIRFMPKRDPCLFMNDILIGRIESTPAATPLKPSLTTRKRLMRY